jgi:ABC-type amino acid transport substrate-binding protein
MRRILFLLLLMAALGYLTGEGIAQPAKAENQPGKGGSILQAVKARGKLIAGVTENEPPLGFLDKDGAFKGFYIDIAEALAKKIFDGKVKVEFVGVPVEKWLDSLKTGKIDILLAPLFMTEGREKQIDFSVPCFVSGALILVEKNSKIRNDQDLAGKSVATIRGSIWETIIRELAPRSKPVLFPHNRDAFQALEEHKVDAFLQLDVFVFYMEEKDRNLRIVNLQPIRPSPAGLGIRKGDKEWLDEVDIALLKMMNSGEYSKLLEKWFGKVRGEFLDLALRKEIKLK